MYKHVFASVYKCVCLLLQTCVIHEPYTLYLMCTVRAYVCMLVCVCVCVCVCVSWLRHLFIPYSAIQWNLFKRKECYTKNKVVCVPCAVSIKLLFHIHVYMYMYKLS